MPLGPQLPPPEPGYQGTTGTGHQSTSRQQPPILPPGFQPIIPQHATGTGGYQAAVTKQQPAVVTGDQRLNEQQQAVGTGGYPQGYQAITDYPPSYASVHNQSGAGKQPSAPVNDY